MKVLKRGFWVIGSLAIVIGLSLAIPVSRYFLIDQFSLRTGSCLVDKTCYRQSYCGGRGDSLGCAYGGSANEWKDNNLRSRYKEIGLSSAKGCLISYITQNARKYTKLQHVRLSTLNISDDTSTIRPSPDELTAIKVRGNLNTDYRAYNPKDTHAYYAELLTDTIPGDKYERGYSLTFHIGAQTCTVYPDTSIYEPF